MKRVNYVIVFFVVVISLFQACKGDGDGFDPDLNGIFTDSRDDRTYNTITIGDITWMKENLKYDAGVNCWLYENDEFYLESYGRLYTWEVAKTVCPSGWELPTNDDWEMLANYVAEDHDDFSMDGNHYLNIAKYLKASSGWVQNNGTDNYGFQAYAGGMRFADDTYSFTGTNGFWWSLDAYDSADGWYWNMDAEDQTLYTYIDEKEYGFSVRCINRNFYVDDDDDDDDKNPDLPVVTSLEVTDVGMTTATLHGRIDSNGGSEITSFGIRWAPINVSFVDIEIENIEDGLFSYTLTGLSPKLDHYFETFATNSAGTSYGELIEFTTACDEGAGIPGEDDFGSFVDERDNISYQTVKIGSQIWMAENLVYKTRDYCWVYDKDENNAAEYGRLYSWEKAKEVCPSGWHLPSNEEWQELNDLIASGVCSSDEWELGTWTEIAANLKSTSGWIEDGNGTNEHGFNGKPGGRYQNTYEGIGSNAYWWTSTGVSDKYAYSRTINAYNHISYVHDDGQKYMGMSVRCVKD